MVAQQPSLRQSDYVLLNVIRASLTIANRAGAIRAGNGGPMAGSRFGEQLCGELEKNSCDAILTVVGQSARRTQRLSCDTSEWNKSVS
jgi:hypothetical protein